MRVVLLSPYPEKISGIIKDVGDEVYTSNYEDWFLELEPESRGNDFVISYGFRHIIPSILIQQYKDRLINIHIGYLPWNRGADPNFWSWHGDTPKGVTIHQMDEGIDTGPILYRRTMFSVDHQTIKSSYERLHYLAITLFESRWRIIREQGITPFVQTGESTSHKKKDREAIWHHFPLGWDTPVKDVEEFGRRSRDEHGQRAGSSGA